MNTAQSLVKRGYSVGAALLVMWLALASAPVFAADVTAGATLYQRHCEGCHGASGRGDFPGMPDFSRGEGLFKPNVTLISSIKAGKVAMPAFEGLLTDDQILDIIAYLRTLR